MEDDKQKDFVKQELKQIKDIDNMIRVKLLEKEEMMTKALGTTRVMSEIKAIGSSGGDKLSEAVIKLIKIKDDIEEEIDILIRTREKVKKGIDLLSNYKYKAILTEYYIIGRTKQEIAEDMKISTKWLSILLDRAIRAYERAVKKKK